MHHDHRHARASFTLTVILPLSLFLAPAARAQTSADLTLVSAYSGRGLGLGSDPALQLRVERDTDGGWYGGAFASPVTLDARRQGQLTAYAGRAMRITSTLSWDAGVTRNAYLRDSHRSYHELYAGLALRRASVRLFYSPSYYGEGRSLYLDLSGAYPLTDQLRRAAHGGLLRPVGAYEEGVARASADMRLALVADVGDVTLQGGWQSRWRTYLAGFPRPHALTASASYHF